MQININIHWCIMPVIESDFNVNWCHNKFKLCNFAINTITFAKVSKKPLQQHVVKLFKDQGNFQSTKLVDL